MFKLIIWYIINTIFIILGLFIFNFFLLFIIFIQSNLPYKKNMDLEKIRFNNVLVVMFLKVSFSNEIKNI